MATRITIIFLWMMFLLLPTTLQAQELRCQELGSNCTCSFTFNTTTWVNEGSNWWWPDENTSKPCGDTVINGKRVAWLTTAPIAVPETGMPAGNTVNHIVRFDNRSGTMIVAGFPPQQLPQPIVGRACMRMYAKVSSDYESTNDGQCENDKWMQMGDYFTAFNSGYTSSNGGGFSPSAAPRDCRNKWCRFEYCVDNWQNPGRYEVYYKNITDATAERSFTFSPRLGVGGVSQFDFWIINGYRQGFCKGYREFSHGMLAVWPSNNGQRIGAAAEIEGNLSPDTTPPAPPKNLRLSSWLGRWLPLSIWSSSFNIFSDDPNAFAASGAAFGSSCRDTSLLQ